jgi:hypothetical protein
MSRVEKKAPINMNLIDFNFSISAIKMKSKQNKIKTTTTIRKTNILVL